MRIVQMAQFSINPEQLTQAGAQLESAAAVMTADLRALQSTISGAGSPWGGDDAGSLFAVAYGMVLGKAFETMASRCGQVGYAGEGLAAQAQAFAGTEQTVKANIISAGKPT